MSTLPAFGPLVFTAGPRLKSNGFSGVMRRNLPTLSMSGDTSAVKSVPYCRMPATGLVAPDGRYAGLVAGALLVGSTHSLMILIEAAPIDAASSGSEKLVSRLDVVPQPSCELSAPCIAALRHGTVGRLSVPSGRGARPRGRNTGRSGTATRRS